MGLTISVTLVSKCLFWGWGIGSASLDFTGISGHTMLATSILPVFFYLRIPADSNHLRHLGTTFGLLLAVGVGLSRIVLGAHSVSEVFAGWLIGLAVSTVTIRALGNSVQPSFLAQFSALLLLFAFSGTTANFLPTHNWEVKFALLLSGHNKPFTRHQLRQQKQTARLVGADAVLIQAAEIRCLTRMLCSPLTAVGFPALGMGQLKPAAMRYLVVF